VEEYWHPGAISDLSLADVDGDGESEAVFGAINNPGQGIGHAAAGVLKIPFSRAPRPKAPDTRFPPLTGGGELFYTLLPTWDINQVLSELPILVAMRVDRDRIFVEVPLGQNQAAIYYLDFKLRVLEHRLSDGFAALHQRLYAQRLLDHRLTEAETAAMGRVAQFASAPDGNSPGLQQFWQF
jgi:hypothetical protein